jgi:hypothetical protein
VFGTYPAPTCSGKNAMVGAGGLTSPAASGSH